jgi:ABC-type uncharacterized transport system substrate-binding protein
VAARSARAATGDAGDRISQRRIPEGYAPYVAAFRQGLKEAGYVEDQNTTIEYRWAEGRYDRLPALVAELIERKVTVIAATSSPAARAAKAATSTIPIVFTTGDDPVELGLVASFSRPGGNVTGVSNLLVQLGSKQLGLLRELAPGTTTIATAKLRIPTCREGSGQAE